MKLVLNKTKELDGKIVSIFTIGNYTVTEIKYTDGFMILEVSANKGNYIPEIYCRTNSEGDMRGFAIQTTSYGSLCVEELQKMIKGLNEAVEVVQVLNAQYSEYLKG